MKFLLDTDLLSQRTKPVPHTAASAWMREASGVDLAISAVSMMEVQAGIAPLPAGKRKRELTSWLEDSIGSAFRDNILMVTTEIAFDAGRLIGESMAAGFQTTPADALIAATARRHGLTLVKLNAKHFQRLAVPLLAF